MTRTRAELAATLLKAARGAGLPLALAEDLYHMADYLEPEDVIWIADDLSQGGAGLVAGMEALDRVACGAALTSASPVIPAMAAARGFGIENGRKTDQAARPGTGPLTIPEAVWDGLSTLAARTYVPETAASRARGAGAGSIDND